MVKPPSPMTPRASDIPSLPSLKIPTLERSKRAARRQRRNSILINENKSSNQNMSKTVTRTNKTTVRESRYTRSPGPHVRNVKINKSVRTTETRVQGNISQDRKNECCSCFGSCVFHDNNVNAANANASTTTHHPRRL